MLNALFGLVQSTPSTTHPTEAALTPYQLPPMYYNDFYEDLLTNKRNDVHSAGCDCKVMVSTGFNFLQLLIRSPLLRMIFLTWAAHTFPGI